MLPRKLLIFTLLCSAPAGAGTPSESVPKNGSDEIRAAGLMLSLYRNELDCEKVGFLQTGEPQEHLAPIFMSLDIDQSKRLSRSELVNMPYVKNKSLLGVAFSRMDRDSDGSVTPEELQYFLDDAIASVDSNGDGDVYPVEYEHALNTGTLLKTDTSITHSKTKQAYTIPPWERHQKAIKQQTAKSSKKPEPHNH